WVDNVYPVEVVYRQFSRSKRYENGLFNFSKRGIVEFTDDYAYVLFDDDVHIYTGVTSVGKDESNVGFAYVDLRNGEISYIRKAGAEEYSARSSSEGALQQYHYSAIFPSMVNVKGRPTYFMGLVDGANLIKSYAFVSYENYQNVATGITVEEAYKNYLSLYEGGDDVPDEEKKEISFTVAKVEHIVQDGNTLILLQSEEGQIYFYDVNLGDLRAPFIAQGSSVKVLADEKGKIYGFLNIGS
ncbi:MAG: CvpA family protein, partial [Erysipelotrichaceae bacterium]|nr:CvpA family protein [Erysipelotrichaceae bacterium]